MCRTRAVNKKNNRLHAVEQSFEEKTSQNVPQWDAERKLTPRWRSHVVRGNGPSSFSLHMGHCIVMGEALLVVVVPQEASRIGTYSHFKMSHLARPPEHAAHAYVPGWRCWSSGQGRGELLHATHDATGLPKTIKKKRPCQTTNLAPCCYSLFYGRTPENNPLRVLLNIPWHSSSLCDSIFYHKGSRRTSAWERILAELGTFQGPGLRGPFGLGRVSGILFTEATVPSLALTSLE